MRKLPPRRIGRQSFLEQRDRLVRPARPIGWREREEDRAESICDEKVGVEGGRDVQERLEQFEPACAVAVLVVAPVVLDRADPIDIRHETVERQGEPIGRTPGSEIEEAIGGFGQGKVLLSSVQHFC
jgi:hypothetical protein